jgi:hypothetical protein
VPILVGGGNAAELTLIDKPFPPYEQRVPTDEGVARLILEPDQLALITLFFRLPAGSPGARVVTRSFRISFRPSSTIRRKRSFSIISSKEESSDSRQELSWLKPEHPGLDS